MTVDETPRSPPWRPALSLIGSAGLHLAAIGAVSLQSRYWPWALGAVAANHLVLAVAGLLPRSSLLGPNWTRLPAASIARREIAITIDDGPDPQVTPAVLELLSRHEARATFFCIGEQVERHPGLAREIVARGHAIENHSQTHRLDFSVLGWKGLRREVESAQQSIERIVGIRPRFFRAPAGLRSPLLDPVLNHSGLTLASWSRRGFDTRNGNGEVIANRLLRGFGAGDILLLHDGHAARTPRGEAVLLAALPPILAAAHAQRLNCVTLRAAAM